MHAFDVLGDPVRRRILDLLVDGEQSSGAITAAIRTEFGLSPAGVSQHLRVLRENGFTTVRPAGAHRLYAVSPSRLQEVDSWLEPFRQYWNPHLDALATELARGRRERRRRPQATAQATAQATPHPEPAATESSTAAPNHHPSDERESP